MSRLKDRERFEAMQRLDTDYLGFRGYAQEPGQDIIPLKLMNCTVCGRTRNVPLENAVEQRDGYVCSSCRKEQGMEAQGFAQDG